VFDCCFNVFFKVNEVRHVLVLYFDKCSSCEALLIAFVNVVRKRLLCCSSARVFAHVVSHCDVTLASDEAS